MECISDRLSIQRINATLQRGGWECIATGLRETDLLEANQNLIVTWRPMLGDAVLPIRTAFNGYVIPSRFQFDKTGSQANFTAETSDGYLRRGWIQGIGFADVQADGLTRAHYHQFDNVNAEQMTMGRIVRHILGYQDPYADIGPNWVAHTNMVYHATENPHGWINLAGVETTPFVLVGNPDGTMRVDRFTVRETNNLWEKLREIAHNEFFEIWFDKNNQLHYARHPMYQAVLPAPVMTFDEAFSLTPPVIEPRDFQRVRQVILHAVTDGGNTLHAEYPPSPTHVYGKVEEITHIRCNDQNTLNYWCMRHYGFLNRDYTVRWSAPGLCGLLFEILDRVNITYAGTDANGSHINWNDKKFWGHEITVTPGDGFTGRSDFLLEAEGE